MNGRIVESPWSAAAVTGGVVVAGVVPWLITDPYYLHTATMALIFVVLASAFNLIFGKVGALSLGQPLFYAVGAYAAAVTSTEWGWTWWQECLFALTVGVVLSILVGVPSFRLSQHAFAVGTLGFALIGQLVAMNWMDVTRGPLCIAGVPALTIPYPGGQFQAITERDYYVVAFVIAVVALGFLGLVYRSGLGRVFTAVRDDDVLAAARGMAPTGVRLTAFAIGAALTALAGAFAAHFQQVVCPSQGDMAVTTLLLIMVLIGGRGSVKGVAVAAVVFTVLPQVLRMAQEWRMVIFAILLLLTVIFLPGGFAELTRRPAKWWRSRRQTTPEEVSRDA